MTRAKCFVICLLAAYLVAPAVAAAQAANTVEPILRSTIEPPRVVVGQKATLRIDVLAPNYLTAPPDLPDFQIRNAVTRRMPNLNLSERRGGTTYAGVRFEFAIYPQEAGSYAIADQKVNVTYAVEPPRSRTLALALPRISFEAFVPPAAAGLDPFVAANSLAIGQSLQKSSDRLEVGDAVTRVVTSKATGTPAMLLPPIVFSPADGLALYPAQPSLQDRTDPRTDELSSTRIDAATYMLEKPGEYVLPAIELRWWNARDQRIERAQLESIALHVSGGPSPQSTTSGKDGMAGGSWDEFVDAVADHWRLAVLAIVALAVIAWLTPRAAQALAALYRQHRESYLASESWSFRRLRTAARRRDANATYTALLDWLARFEPLAPRPTIVALQTAAADPVLDAQIGLIERRLFSPHASPGDWSPHTLLQRVSVARRRLQRTTLRSGSACPLSPGLNPVGPSPVIVGIGAVKFRMHA